LDELLRDIRSGIGYDIHPLGKGRKLILGGVEIPHKKGLIGHSDGDVLSHAVMDSLLGAAALGDIGCWFPDNEPAFEGVRSADLLRRVYQILLEKGWRISNIDVTVIAEVPKISPFREKIRTSLGEAVKLPLDRVNIKATTHEKMGSLGRGEGIACVAVSLVFPVS